MRPFTGRSLVIINTVIFLSVLLLDQEYSFRLMTIVPLVLYFLFLFFLFIRFIMVVFTRPNNKMKIFLQTLSLLAVFITGFIVSTLYLDYCVVQAETRGSEIVKSLKDFYTDQGHYPDQLNQLVPRYIESIPATSIGLIPRSFNYVVEDDGEKFILSFNIHFGVIGFNTGNRWVYDD